MTSAFNDSFDTSDEGLLEELNPGGSGRFLYYRQRRFGVLHFVKKVAPEYEGDPLTEQSLLKEFQVGYGFNHPNIVRYLAYENGCLYEEFVEGPTLRTLIDSKDDRLSQPGFIAKVCTQLLEGLGYLHDNGLAYLDLKPENIIISRIGDNVKIIDLGAAVSSSYDSTPGSTKGYEAPEQKTGKTDQRTDIYQLGLIMAEMAKAGNRLRNFRKFIKVATREVPSGRFSSCREALEALTRKEKSPKNFYFAVFVLFILIGAALAVIWFGMNEESDVSNSEANVAEVVKPEPAKDTIRIIEKEVRTEVPFNRSPVVYQTPKKHPNLKKTVEKEVEKIFEHRINPVIANWQLNEEGKVPENRYQDYMKLLGRSYDEALAYGEKMSAKYPEERNEIETTIRQTSENVVARYHRKYYYY